MSIAHPRAWTVDQNEHFGSLRNENEEARPACLFASILVNGQSLLLCWYFIMSSPEPQPIEKLDDEDNNKS